MNSRKDESMDKMLDQIVNTFSDIITNPMYLVIGFILIIVVLLLLDLD
jgi:low affinity Fe/Cu permease